MTMLVLLHTRRLLLLWLLLLRLRCKPIGRALLLQLPRVPTLIRLLRLLRLLLLLLLLLLCLLLLLLLLCLLEICLLLLLLLLLLLVVVVWRGGWLLLRLAESLSVPCNPLRDPIRSIRVVQCRLSTALCLRTPQSGWPGAVRSHRLALPLLDIVQG
jgi:hypothetical protein